MSDPQGQFPGSIWVPSSQYWTGRSGHRIRYVIVHGTAWPGPASAMTIAHFFQHPDRPTSTHYVVGKDGQVVQCVREEDSAWGNGIVTAGHDAWWGTRGNPNLETISIEHVKTTSDNHESLTAAQAEASFRLIAYLCAKWGIPGRWADAEGGITGHFSIDPVNRKYCPGPYPWVELFQQLAQSPYQPSVPTTYSPLLQQGMPTGAQPSPLSSGIPELQTNPAAAPGRSAGAAAHAVLAELPGFAGIVEAVDAGEAFSAPARVNGPADIAGWVGSNALALLLRVLLVALGLVVVVGLLLSLARGNAWVGQAGGDAVPLVLGQA